MGQHHSTEDPPRQEVLKRISYMSNAAIPFDKKNLFILGSNAMRKNTERNISGALVFCNNVFLQTIEGPPEDLDTIFSVIKEDPRHRDVFVFLEERGTLTRQFSQWGMKLITPECPEFSEVVPRLVATSFQGASAWMKAVAMNEGQSGVVAVSPPVPTAPATTEPQTTLSPVRTRHLSPAIRTRSKSPPQPQDIPLRTVPRMARSISPPQAIAGRRREDSAI